MNELYRSLPRPHKVLITLISVLTLTMIFLPTEDATASRNRVSIGEAVPLVLDLDPPPATPLDDEPAISAEQAEAVEPVVAAYPDLDSIELLEPDTSVDSTAVIEPVAEPVTPIDPAATTAPEVAPDDGLAWQQQKVIKGDSLARLFQRAGLSANELQMVLNAGPAAKQVQSLKPGEVLEFGVNDAGQLQALRYRVDPLLTLLLEREGLAFKVEELRRQYQTETRVASAQIHSSFYLAGKDAGLSSQQIMAVANIFSWDIDFALDLRKGDSFSVLFEQRYVEGEKLGNGEILAAEFTNNQQRYQAVRHTDGSYYSPDGKALRKAFLRAPVEFKYVSSEFNPRRLHPVTGQVRAHRGIDYAAAVGTPVMAAGNGTVIESGYSGLNGNYVVIRHNTTYTTKYLHLNRRAVQRGQRVNQGQIIGTVGATGRVTGAHLHYEFIVNGVHRNPRSVKLPDADGLSGNERAAFVEYANALISQIDNHRQATGIASAAAPASVQ